ncbi:MAG TPA: carbohydrate kinase family protein, partial [Dermatophilaceae bacterium]|nr:carbohydrate kinase family protein [Dermatophilaceae bacterium]
MITEDFRGDDAPKDDRRRDDRVKDERGEAAPSLTLQSLSVDVLVVGVTYLDVVVADLDEFPGPGEEARAGGLTLCPGGIATRAVATARLGLDTVLSTSLGTDRAGALVRAALGQEAVRLDLADDLAGASTPVTVSVAHDG